MPAPIIVGQQRNPFENLLMNLYLTKFQHKLRMEETDKALQAEKLRIEENRQYTESREKAKERGELMKGGWRETGAEKGAIYNPIAGDSYLPPQPKVINVGTEKYVETSPGKFNKMTSELTTDIKNYNQAVQQGYTGDFNTWYLNVKKAGAPKVSTTVNTGDLTPTVKTQVQKEVISLEERLVDLKNIKDDFKADYLTYWGQGKRFALRQADKLGMDIGEEGQQFVQGARRFTEGVEQIFNAYRKDVTGAQAAVKELAMLRDSILNKKLSPSEFDASVDRYMEQVERHLALKKMFLAQGINPKNIGRKIDSVFASERNIPNKAPLEAIQALMQNPSLKMQFKQKYGYLPRGM